MVLVMSRRSSGADLGFVIWKLEFENDDVRFRNGKMFWVLGIIKGGIDGNGIVYRTDL